MTHFSYGVIPGEDPGSHCTNDAKSKTRLGSPFRGAKKNRNMRGAQPISYALCTICFYYSKLSAEKISTFLVSYVRIIKQHEKVHCVKEETVWD